MEDSLKYLQGFTTSILVKTLCAPLERYRLIRQTQDILTLSSKEKMTNLFAYTRQIIKHQGVTALWRSNLTSIYMWFPQIFAQATFYQNIKQTLYSSDPTQPEYMNLLYNTLCASACSLTTLLVTHPFDTIRVRQATELGTQRVYTSFSETRFQIQQESGLKALFSGLSVAALQTILLSTLTIGLHQQMNTLDIPYYSDQVAFMAAFAILYPLDSIKHRLQVRSILFQQETLKKANMLDKLKLNLRDFSFKWTFGGFWAHNVRMVGIIALNSQMEGMYNNILKMY